MLIVDINWTYKNKLVPALDTLKDSEVLSVELSDYDLSFNLSTDKFCTGYYKKGEYVPCSYKNKLSSKFEVRCAYCERQLGFKQAFFFNEDPNENIKEKMEREHYIYLAFFAPNILKVGTTDVNREKLRLIEQDALIFALIGKVPDANEAKKLERFISSKFGITETVKASHKYKMLSDKPSFKMAEEQINFHYNKIKVGIDENFNEYILDKVEIVDITSKQEIYFPEKYFKLEDSLVLQGKFKGLRGNFLIIENNKNDFVFDKRWIIGRKISYLENNYVYNTNDNQLSLF